MKTIAEQLIQLNQIKSDIKQAIIAKGVAVSDDDGFESYADKVSQIRVQTITFKINNVTYEALPNMTWREWRFSDYNTGGLWLYKSIEEDPTVFYIAFRDSYDIATFIAQYGSNSETENNIIIANARYENSYSPIGSEDDIWE